VTALAMKTSYSRAAVQRLLQISNRQLRTWERQKLIAPADEYGFRQLVALRTLIQLRKSRIPVEQIQRAIRAVTLKLGGLEDPLTELKLYAQGKRIRVELDGKAMEAESGQLLLDFSHGELSRLLQFQAKEDARAQQTQRQEAEHWFTRGLELEQSGAPVEEVTEAYKKAVELDARTAGAFVNLGTIYFNARNWAEAEEHYKKALEADPEYSLAHFDLANLYDERGDRESALRHYARAIEIAPGYADAHYNLALLYQGSGQTMKAVSHWTTYLKLDRSSQWSTVARRELTKLRHAAVVPPRS
jgi:tetratricopeptide (TPR) repeat protein